MLAGLIPALLVLGLSYYSLEGLDPATIAELHEPQVDAGRHRSAAIEDYLRERRDAWRTAVAERTRSSDALTAPDARFPSDFLVERIEWRVPRDRGAGPGFSPFVDVHPDGRLARRIFREAHQLDPAAIHGYAETLGGTIPHPDFPKPIEVVDRSVLEPTEAWDLSRSGDVVRLVVPVPVGELVIESDTAKFLSSALDVATERSARPGSDLEVRLVRRDREASRAPWARWPLPEPFHRDWELWTSRRVDPTAYLIDAIQRLDRWHVVTFGTVVLAVLTIASVILAGVVSRRAKISRQKDDFVRLVSHELRTPLAAIRMIAETLSLERYRTPEDRNEYLRQLDLESLRLVDLVERVLEYGTGAGEREVVSNPESIVREAVENFASRKSGEREVQISTTQEFHPVLLDREAIRGVVTNLLSNAAKYSPSDLPIEVTVGEESRHLFIEVRDHGPGIDPTEQRKIFRPFYRGRERGKAGGFGLGLAYCRQVVRDHGGRIQVRSRPGEGARFTVEIPLLGRRSASTPSH